MSAAPDLHVSIRGDTVSVSWRFERTYAFDLEGRLLSAFRDGVSFVRGLRGRTQARWRDPLGPVRTRARHALDERESRELLDASDQIIDDARRYAMASPTRISIGEPGVAAPVPAGRFLDWVDSRRIASAADHRTDEERWRSILSPVGIMPPDQYRAMVVQATTGCPYNRCTFCTFYKGEPFHVRSPDDVARHVKAIVHRLGRGVRRYRNVFVGSGNPFVVEPSRLIRMIHALQDSLGPWPGGAAGHSPPRVGWPLVGFIDIFGPRPGGSRGGGLRPLVELGLSRLYVGLESGSARVLDLLGKPGSRRQAHDLLADARAAGLAMGLIVLAGAGGRTMAREHVDATVELLASLSPQASDIVYVSPLVITPGSDYDSESYARGLDPLSDAELYDQAREIRTRLDIGRPGRARFAIYDVRDFVF